MYRPPLSPPTNLILVAPPGADGSALGFALARTLAWTFHPPMHEVLLAQDGPGEEEEEEERGASPRANVARLIAAEAGRDAAWLRRLALSGGSSRVVAQWQLGHVATARAAGTSAPGSLLSPARQLVRELPDTVVLPLTMSDTALVGRSGSPTPDVAAARAFEREALQLAQAWDLPVLPALDISDLPVDEAVAHVLVLLAATGHVAAQPA